MWLSLLQCLLRRRLFQILPLHPLLAVEWLQPLGAAEVGAKVDAEVDAVLAGVVEGEELRVEAGAEFMQTSPTRSPQQRRRRLVQLSDVVGVEVSGKAAAVGPMAVARVAAMRALPYPTQLRLVSVPLMEGLCSNILPRRNFHNICLLVLRSKHFPDVVSIRMLYLSGMELVHVDDGRCGPPEQRHGCHLLLNSIGFPCEPGCRSYLFAHSFASLHEWREVYASANP
jgi:hypothetical protein